MSVQGSGVPDRTEGNQAGHDAGHNVCNLDIMFSFHDCVLISIFTLSMVC